MPINHDRLCRIPNILYRNEPGHDMGQSDFVKPHYPPDAFVGTARYYARYRVPYPSTLMQDLVRRAGVTGQGRLLDLACGPGRVAFALAGYFQEIWAIDQEP